MELYPFQKEGVREIEQLFQKKPKVCLAWYTGAGKTNVIAEFCKRRIKENPNVKIGISAYLMTEIRDQVEERLKEFGLEEHIHTVRYGLPKYSETKAITVFNPQALFRKPPKVKFDYLILDEAHTGVNPSCLMLPKIIRKCTNNRSKILLVSATPWDTLAQKEFEGCPVLKRPLDQGFSDGLITDFKFHAEEAEIEFSDKDFSRKGDLTKQAATREMERLKSVCIGKVEHILQKYGDQLGKKILVICPPGNYSETAREMAKRFKGLAFTTGKTKETGRDVREKEAELEDYTENLEIFKKDQSIRMLFVVQKCQVGFDYQELTSVIDLSMSRNIRTLAQRMGRIARKSGSVKKKYIYVYDKSLMKNRLEWLIATTLDFCLGAYDGWTTKTAKWRAVEVNQKTMVHPITTTISEIIKALRDKSAINTKRIIKFINGEPPKKRTLEQAIEEIKQYESRHILWQEKPALYKWFRLNAKEEMDRIFPLVNKIGKWHEKSIIEAMKACSTRYEFNRKFAGAADWMRVNKKQDLKEKYLPKSKTTRRWQKESIKELLMNMRSWSHVRNYSGARRWMHHHKGEAFWRRQWERMHNRKAPDKELDPPREWKKSKKKLA